MAIINKRNVPGNKVKDTAIIANLIYSESSGAQKNSEVGRYLVPLKSDATTYTTDATTARALPSPGRNLAVYNNNTAIGAVTLGTDSTVSALAAGVVDASGNVGIACKPGDWTYIACSEKSWVKSTAATLLVYLIEDDSFIRAEASR